MADQQYQHLAQPRGCHTPKPKPTAQHHPLKSSTRPFPSCVSQRERNIISGQRTTHSTFELEGPVTSVKSKHAQSGHHEHFFCHGCCPQKFTHRSCSASLRCIETDAHAQRSRAGACKSHSIRTHVCNMASCQSQQATTNHVQRRFRPDGHWIHPENAENHDHCFEGCDAV